MRYNFEDMDTARGMRAYQEQGYIVRSPDQVRALGRETVKEIATSCGDILQETYQGTYPLDAGDAEALTNSVMQEGSGATHLFTVERAGRLEGMSGIVEKPNPLGGAVCLAELGRAAKSPEASLSLRALLKTRVPWAAKNLPHVDFLSSSTRSATQYNPDIPSGKGVQSVWWGGQARAETRLPLFTTRAGWDYKLGGVEPFTSFVIPTDPQKWAKHANQQEIYVGSTQEKDALHTLLGEASRGAVRPTIKVSVPVNGAPKVGFTRLAPPSEVAASTYVMQPVNSEKLDLTFRAISAEEEFTIASNVVIEPSISGNPAASGIMRSLARRGFTFTGWQPSFTTYGGISPVYSRLNPAVLPEVVQPEHHAKYFDAAGLRRTKQFLDNTYRRLQSKAKERS